MTFLSLSYRIRRLIDPATSAFITFRFRRHQLRFYRQFIAAGSTCFDVGANIGNRVGVFLALGATVVAVEPQHELAETLLRKFQDSRKLVLIEKAVGSAQGRATLRVSEVSTIATLSTAFISATQQSGRFSHYSWDGALDVAVTTLDALILKHGMPVFCKIDVEGYEDAVLKGLTHPLKYVSFEYTPEVIHVAIACVEHLSRLGLYEYNLSRGESLEWALAEWVGASQMSDILRAERYPSWGDVYARRRDSV